MPVKHARYFRCQRPVEHNKKIANCSNEKMGFNLYVAIVSQQWCHFTTLVHSNACQTLPGQKRVLTIPFVSTRNKLKNFHYM